MLSQSFESYQTLEPTSLDIVWVLKNTYFPVKKYGTSDRKKALWGCWWSEKQGRVGGDRPVGASSGVALEAVLCPWRSSCRRPLLLGLTFKSSYILYIFHVDVYAALMFTGLLSNSEYSEILKLIWHLEKESSVYASNLCHIFEPSFTESLNYCIRHWPNW